MEQTNCRSPQDDIVLLVVDHSGHEHTLPALEGWRVMEVIRDWGVPLKATCGGACACASCHVYVDDHWVSRLAPPSTEEEDRLRRGDDVRVLATESGPWLGGSSWQSTARGTGSIEADFLNGEIVLLARMVGLEAPVNALLQQMADRLAASGAPPGGEDPDLLLRQARA